MGAKIMLKHKIFSWRDEQDILMHISKDWIPHCLLVSSKIFLVLDVSWLIYADVVRGMQSLSWDSWSHQKFGSDNLKRGYWSTRWEDMVLFCGWGMKQVILYEYIQFLFSIWATTLFCFPFNAILQSVHLISIYACTCWLLYIFETKPSIIQNE